MKLYIELYFSSEGKPAETVIKKMKNMEFEPVVGQYDFAKEYNNSEQYANIVKTLSRELNGTKTRYRLITRKK
ncbi:MAG: hypothetical protein ACOC53_03175 [Candidatus Saliniplasma sp.]